jgi:hypothetical protein
MCGQLQVGKDFLHVCSIGRCSHVFGLLSAVHLTAGRNALRGSGPGHKRAFDATAPGRCNDPELGEMRADCIDDCSLLADEEVACAVEHQAALLQHQ